MGDDPRTSYRGKRARAREAIDEGGGGAEISHTNSPFATIQFELMLDTVFEHQRLCLNLRSYRYVRVIDMYLQIVKRLSIQCLHPPNVTNAMKRERESRSS